MAFNPELAERQLIGIYQRAYTNLLQAIVDAQRKGNVTGFQQGMLADINSILNELDGASIEWARQSIPKLYQAGRIAALQAWRQANLTPPAMQAGFSVVHREAVRLMAENLYDNLSDANRFLGRRVRDAWRRSQLEVIAEKLPSGQTMRQAQKRLQERIATQGLGAFQDSRGRIWRMDTYANMAVRTVTAEAQNMGTMNQLRGMGRDLVQMTTHFAPCETCAIYEGRTYSITGQDKRFPPLSRIPGFSEGYGTIHPNCRHRVFPVVEELATDFNEQIRRSNEPFVDNRSEAEKQRYENEQREQRMRRQVERMAEQVSVLPAGKEKEAARERLRQLRKDRTALRKELGIT